MENCKTLFLRNLQTIWADALRNVRHPWPRVCRPLRLVSRSDTYLASCKEMCAQPRVPKVPVFTVYRQTKLCGQHTAVALPDIKWHKNTRTRTDERECVSNLSRISNIWFFWHLTPCTLFTDVSAQPAGSIYYYLSTNKCHSWS